jgi:hypothetical protein
MHRSLHKRSQRQSLQLLPITLRSLRDWEAFTDVRFKPGCAQTRQVEQQSNIETGVCAYMCGDRAWCPAGPPRGLSQQREAAGS